jgi:superoxide dismutase, Cu-Zn family
MVKPAVKAFSVASLAAPVALLAACSPPGEVPSDSPGTTPSIWTGSPAPSTPDDHGGHGSGGHGAAGSLLVPMNDASGAEVATATFDFSSGYVTVTVETTGAGKLAPGFHGLHIHSVGKCEPNSVAPNGGAPGDFNSAGGHFQVPGNSGHPASGDLTSLQVREDGSAKLVTTTDAFTEEDLLAGGKTAIIIHEKADNFANIPPERYNQVNGTPGPDETTMATGDAGKRVACGVITGE